MPPSAPATSLPDVHQPDPEATFADPRWRLRHLYTIKREDTGGLIPFRPRPAQEDILEAIFGRGEKFVIIIKSRRYGFSTLIDLLLLDAAAWSDGFQGSIVDMTQRDAEQKMLNIIHVAWENLPAALRAAYTREAKSSQQIAIRHNHAGGGALSAIYAGANARGGTNNALHITEWGKIQATDTVRSREILTGALPSARKGLIIIETTWEGGKRGELYTLVKQALETPEETKSPHDPRVYFFPWWQDPECTDPEGYVDQDSATYLDALEQEIGRELTDGQRRFYARQRRSLGIFVYREYPSTLEEALRAPIEGAIYADYIEKQRGAGMLSDFGVDTINPVHTLWDLGAPENSPVWFFQILPAEIRFVDFDAGLDEDLTRRVARFRQKGLALGTAFLPHDGGARGKTGHTFEQSLHQAGWTTTAVVPRRVAGPVGIWEGINRVRQMFPSFRFRVPACNDGIESLEAYHTKKEGDVVTRDEPVHDWSSHAADALRVLGEASLHGMLPGHGPSAPAAISANPSRQRPRTGLR